MTPPTLPDDLAASLANNQAELIGFLETLVGFDTQNPPDERVAIVEWLESTLSAGRR
ncbi:hypothetical protein [Halobellus ordinarius]|uniref:hypothetical protein n=1 Tax=Halobellus ordinarius TaxID=3075120 RepID=UPI002880861C|nr:hypothetical protein [Halobellus sp. ZY16]